MVQLEKFPESVFIFGCGYLGTALAQCLLGNGVRVGALTRNAERAAKLSELGLCEVIEAELEQSKWHYLLKYRYDAVVNCVSSAGGGIEGYRKSYVYGQQSILEWAQSQSIKTFVYTSSTSVYPQDEGLLVDEKTNTSAAPPTGQVLLASESLLAESKCFDRWFILRLAGIYGPKRHYLLDQLLDGSVEISGRGDYALNMIYLEDIVRAICTVLDVTRTARSGVYNIVDDGPSLKAEVLAWLAQELSVPEPKFNPKIVSTRLKLRGGCMPHRYVSNAKAREQLGWKPKYPSFREGYAKLLSERIS